MAIAALFVLASCQQESKDLPIEKDFQDVSAIGERIDKAVGQSWIDNFVNQNPNSTRAFLFGKEILTDLLSKDGAAGIWFYKGLTSEGETKLVLYTADENGHIWEASSNQGRVEDGDSPADFSDKCPPDCPGGSGSSRISKNVNEIGGILDRDEAKDWINRFQEQNPDKVRAFLFGKEILNDLLATEGAEGIWFYLALDEANEEKMVLYSADSNGQLWGLTASGAARTEDGGSSDPADDGQGCPPFCPPPGNGD